MIEIRICYLGKRKSGKTSIINYLFKNTKRENTSQIEPTKDKYILEYRTSFLKIYNLEFAGSHENFENLNLEDQELIKKQDVFIFVYDLKSKSTASSLKLLKNQVKMIYKLNKKAKIYIFFHQSDLDFIYQGAKVEESMLIFSNKFENYIKNFFSDNSIMQRYSKKKTSIYDFSINEAMSVVISDQIITKMKGFSKMITEITKGSKMNCITLFDLKSKLYIAKDNIPLDHDTIFLFIDSLKMLSQFEEFNKNYNKNKNFDKDKFDEDFFCNETMVVLKYKKLNNLLWDSVYIKQFDRNLCFVSFIGDFCIENKGLLDRNLRLLREYIVKTVEVSFN